MMYLRGPPNTNILCFDNWPSVLKDFFSCEQWQVDIRILLKLEAARAIKVLNLVRPLRGKALALFVLSWGSRLFEPAAEDDDD